jgi:hypothetical protein
LIFLIAVGRWFSPGIPVTSTNKTDRHDIAEILMKLALNAITITIVMLKKDQATKLYILMIIGMPGENHRPTAINLQPLFYTTEKLYMA